MKYLITLLISLSLVFISGCAHTKRSSIAFIKDSGGSLSIWDADMSAAVGYQDGQICMQRALAIKTIDAGAMVKVSEAMLALSEAAREAATNGTSAELASVTATIKETATLLTTSTERTTFLDLGMFYLCQISANGGITDEQTATLVKIIAVAGASIKTAVDVETLMQADSIEIPDGDNPATPIPRIERIPEIEDVPQVELPASSPQ